MMAHQKPGWPTPEKDKTSEGLAATGSSQLDARMADALMGQGGALGDNLSTAIPGLSDADMVKFHQKIAVNEKVSKAKQRELPKPAEELLPREPLDNLREELPKMLDQEQQARGLLWPSAHMKWVRE